MEIVKKADYEMTREKIGKAEIEDLANFFTIWLIALNKMKNW